MRPQTAPAPLSCGLALLLVACSGGGGGSDSLSAGETQASDASASASSTQGTDGSASSSGANSSGASASQGSSGGGSGETDPGSTGGTSASSASAGTSGDTTGDVTGDPTGDMTTGTTDGVTSTSTSTSTTGDATTGTTGMEPKVCMPVVKGNEMCAAPGLHITCDNDSDPFHAIGLDCPGDATNSTPIFGESFNANDPTTWYTITKYGNDALWTPKEGSKMLIISTGTLDPPNGAGVLTQPAGVTEKLNLGPNRNKTKNPDNQKLPPPMHPIDGSNDGAGGTPFTECDCVNDCSDTLEDQWTLGDAKANDLLWFTFGLDVPGGTYGYEFDFAWFSSEYPEWIDTKYNDVFVVWSTSETYTGNVVFINDQPITVTALAGDVQYKENSNKLAGTGFEGVGGATGWYTATGSAKPYETFSLTWAIFDMGDGVLDTTVLLDNFRWDCAGCKPGDDCGIIPQ